ncbi:MAG: class II aldolase/adducin family protein [Anaerolineae bacterium]|nr:class II aldolase/adducin family protein [Anaerolineae bacterium]
MTLLDRFSSQVERFVRVCHRLSQNMYVASHGGNLAWKLESDLILITPTQMNKGDITPQDLVFIRPSGEVLEGTRRPTGETPMYVNFFRERPDIVSVLHCHPPMTGAFALTKGENWLMRPILPETIMEVGPVPVVPYGEPLTQRLADNFLPYVQKYNAFLMENHGLVLLSRGDIQWALMCTEILEGSALTILQALTLGEIKELSEEDVRNLENTMRTRNLPMFGAPGVNTSLVDVYFPGGA